MILSCEKVELRRSSIGEGIAVDKFPIERVSWGNGVKFLQDEISVVGFCNTNFSLFLSLLYLILHLTSSVLRHREKNFAPLSDKTF